MKLKTQRGSYGHINAEKKRLFLGAIGMVFLGLCVFFLGLCLNKFQTRNIFSVFAVLFVLPMARYLSTLLVLLPFHTPKRELYDQVTAVLPEGVVLFSDYAFSSPERVMGLAFFAVSDNELLGLGLRENENIEKIRLYLSDCLKRRGMSGKVTICDKEQDFLAKVGRLSEGKKTEEERNEVLDFLRSLAI